MKRLPLPLAVRAFLSDEERAASAVIWGAAAVVGLCLVLALVAMLVSG